MDKEARLILDFFSNSCWSDIPYTKFRRPFFLNGVRLNWIFILDMKLIWCTRTWNWSSGTVKIVKYLFVGISPKSTLYGSGFINGSRRSLKIIWICFEYLKINKYEHTIYKRFCLVSLLTGISTCGPFPINEPWHLRLLISKNNCVLNYWCVFCASLVLCR